MTRRIWFVLPLFALGCDTTRAEADDGLPPVPGEAPRPLTIHNGAALPAEGAPHATLITPGAPPRSIPDDQADQLLPPLEEQAPSGAEQAPPQLEQGSVTAPDAMPVQQYAYLGGHPIPAQFGGGWCTVEGSHTHPYPPEVPEFFAYNDNVWTFGVGDEWIYYDGHPIPGVWGGGWCDLPGKHYHGFRPSTGYSYDGGRRGFVYSQPANGGGRGTSATAGGPSLPAGTRAVTPVAVQPLKPGSSNGSPSSSGWPSTASASHSTATAARPMMEAQMPSVVRLPSAPAAFPGVRVVRPSPVGPSAQRGAIGTARPYTARPSVARPYSHYYAPRTAYPGRAFGRSSAPRGFSTGTSRPFYGGSSAPSFHGGGGFRGGGGGRGGGRR